MRSSKTILFSICIAFLFASICLFTFSAPWMHASAANLTGEQQTEQQQDQTLTLTRTVGTDPTACGQTNEVRVLPGMAVYECLTVTNSAEFSLTVYAAVNSTEISIPVAVGQTVIVTNSQAVGGRFVFTPTASTVSTSMHQAVGVDVTGANTVISGTVKTQVNMIGTQTDHIAFAHTLSTKPEDCSMEDSIDVEPSTQVYSCFTAFNRSSAPITMTLFTVPDHYYYDASGELPDALSPLPPFIWTLAPGESGKLSDSGLFSRLAFTATKSLNTTGTISYQVDNDTASTATALARVNVGTGSNASTELIHLPLMFTSTD